MFEREFIQTMPENNTLIENEKVNVEVIKLADGFGFGEGGISYLDRREVVGETVLEKVEHAIESEQILVPVSRDKQGNILTDDGCGDGRRVKRVFEGATERRKSLARPKVFGGGVAMRAAMDIGAGEAAGKSVNNLFSASIKSLKDRMISFGAHTDTHANGENSGCGAIDRSPVIVKNAVKFSSEIKESIGALGIDTDGIDEIFDNFEAYSNEISSQDYSGRKVVSEIIQNDKVVKELDDSHLEMFVLLNTVEGYTVDQELIRSVSDGSAQAFGVDVWRLQKIAKETYPGDLESQNKAFLSELVYTLATSATLTRGDLPVRVIQKKA